MGINSVAAAGGSVFAIFVTILVLHYLWRLGCFSRCKQVDERVASPSQSIELASPTLQNEHRVVEIGPSEREAGKATSKADEKQEESPSKIFCSACGAKLTGGKFCAQCGEKC